MSWKLDWWLYGEEPYSTGLALPAGGDRDSGMVVVVVEEGLVGLGPGRAVAVRDLGRAEVDGRVHGGAEIAVLRRVGRGHRLVGRVCLDEQDVAVRADGRHHLDVERDLGLPAGVCDGGIAPLLAVLLHLPEAAVRGGARRQAVVRAVRGPVRLDRRIVVRS